ncbi:tRNA (adenosine(37)-N6)-threonylcarbamoyltransferase complex transferase subunit TsaD [Candidatus Omnitrophota bacterium]
MFVLGIETSCDDTSAAVYHSESRLLSSVVSSQLEHLEFGGVVPELASRAHLSLILPVIGEALSKAHIALDDVDGIAVTAGPGLVGSLLIGVSVGKSLALSRNIPMIGVHHIEGHILSNFIEEPVPSYPYLVLIVSGGHTELVVSEKPFDYRVIGATRDDAAGEAFDKVAKLLGLEYPGGPVIDKLAGQGDSDFIDYPVSKVPDYEFSFSGLKTAVLVSVKKMGDDAVRTVVPHICASFQKAVVEALVVKTLKALRDYGIDNLLIAGGVAANSALKKRFRTEADRQDFHLFVPSPEYCTDNAAMIALAGHERLKYGFSSPLTLSPEPRLSL